MVCVDQLNRYCMYHIPVSFKYKIDSNTILRLKLRINIQILITDLSFLHPKANYVTFSI